MVMTYSVASINPLVISHHYGKWPWTNPNPGDFSNLFPWWICPRYVVTLPRGQVIRAEELLEQLRASTEQLNPEKVRPGDGGNGGMMEGWRGWVSQICWAVLRMRMIGAHEN